MECGHDRKRHRNNEAEDRCRALIGSPARTRWSPTGEQKQILESLYGQGIRKPSAEQIDQITNRLRAFGQIEGKNVFYWFHNHKAKLRLKLKQEQEQEQQQRITNNILMPNSPIDTTIQVRNSCFHEQDSNIQLDSYTTGSSTTRSSLSLDKQLQSHIISDIEGLGYESGRGSEDSCHVVNDENATTTSITNISNSSDNRQTLVLFPLTPTVTSRGRDCHEKERFFRSG